MEVAIVSLFFADIVILLINFKYGIYFFLFLIFCIFCLPFITTFEKVFSEGNFEKNEVFYQYYKGDYNSLYSYQNKFSKIKKEYKLPDYYKPFGIFYEDPKKKNNLNNKCLIGIIIYKNIETNEKGESLTKELNIKNDNFDDTSFKEYMQKNDYRRAFIQKTNCVIGVYQFLFKTLLSHISFSKIYISLTNMKFFSHLFHRELPDENLKKARANYKKEVGVLIIYGKNSNRYFIPIDKEKNFKL